MLTIEMQEKIAQLKEKRNAVILAHNYQDDDVQEIADYCGDSFELSRMAAGSRCGGHCFLRGLTSWRKARPF